MTDKTYFASKARHWQFVSALVAAGAPFISTWHSWKPNSEERHATPAEWAEHSERCLTQAGDADVCILYYEDTERHFGSLLEAGACLGRGGWVYLVANEELPFLRNHPRCRSFPDLAAAIAALNIQREE
jgi:hypothetical protein